MTNQTKDLFNSYLDIYKTTYEKSVDTFKSFNENNPFFNQQENNPFFNQQENNPFFNQQENNKQHFDYLNPTLKSLNNAMLSWIKTAFNDEEKLMSQKKDLLEKITLLNEYFIERMKGTENLKNVVDVSKKDRRFKDEEWSTNPFFDFLKQFYLIYTDWVNEVIESNDDIDEKSKASVKFYVKQITEAMSPSNFIFSNPELIRETLDQNGANLIDGMKNLKDDLENSELGQFQIKQNNNDDFEVGVNIATSEGKVIFKNDLIELIQYSPKTEQTYQKPVLIIPPYINKFYVMDLNEQKSMVNWLLDKKVTVFMISWKNPDSSYAGYDFNDYVQKGTYEALKVIETHLGEKNIHTVGYCVGGTLLALTMGYLEAIKESDRISNATFLATLVDFENAGELDVFIDEEQVSSIEQKMNKLGYFDGKDMANTFNALRPGDLFWGYVVNNYMLGKQPSSFDVLFWNSDTTRLPATLHSEYLRKMYMQNLLVQENGMSILGKQINLKNVKQDIFCVATTDDHIVPWKSAYKIKNAVGSKNIEFVLSNSGHMMGIIQGTSPVPKKYNYRTNPRNYKNADQWHNFAKKNIGSWWSYWNKWLEKNLGELTEARQPENGTLKTIGNAPGEYVKQK